MKKYAMMTAMVLTGLSALAQETYENARLMETDLNGTARYVGMGGAMDALGADLSTISTNPAGIGMFRHSTVNTSFGVVSQQGGQSFRNGSKTNFSFDQIGFVYSFRTNKTSYFNFAFNFHKSQNFDYILSAAAALDGKSSQNGLSFIKGIGATKDGNSTYNFDRGYGTMWWTSQLDNLYYNALIVDKNTHAPYWCAANGFQFNRANTGYIGVYDINVSGNINNRVYLGLTVGIHDVHYHGVSEYTESAVNIDEKPAGSLTVDDDRRITGTGFDVKVGAIIRPVEDSPFRFGLSVASPTFYTLKTRNQTRLFNRLDNSAFSAPWDPYNPQYVASSSYEFKMNTPWRFGLSLGHTIDQFVALGAGFEYANYGSIDTREITNGYYDSWSNTYSKSSASDTEMNNHTERTLKGVVTAKVGAEIKVDPNVSLRFGYNYLSPMYKEDGMKDFDVDSYGTNTSSATDYTNWKATHRLTCGIGMRFDHFSLDLAYQYQVRNGDFHAFQSAWGDYVYTETENGVVKQVTEQIDVTSPVVSVSNKRHQLLLTLGYTF